MTNLVIKPRKGDFAPVEFIKIPTDSFEKLVEAVGIEYAYRALMNTVKKASADHVRAAIEAGEKVGSTNDFVPVVGRKVRTAVDRAEALLASLSDEDKARILATVATNRTKPAKAA